MRKVRVLVAVQPLPLMRVVEHLLGAAPEIQIIPRSYATLSLAQQAKRLQPDLIIANSTFLGDKAFDVLNSIKRASPRGKLIFMAFDAGMSGLARQCGVDAYLDEEVLVKQLLSAARRLAAQCRPAKALKGRARTTTRWTRRAR